MQAHQAWKVFNMCSRAGPCMPRLPAPLTPSAVRLAVLTGMSTLPPPDRQLPPRCREHISLSPADTEFWSWSFHEMAAYDLPAVIDFICSATGARELGYVGHSQGTTMGFAAFSSQPELADKVPCCSVLHWPWSAVECPAAIHQKSNCCMLIPCMAG